MKRSLYLLIIAAIIDSCSDGKKEKEIPAGGPCSYTERFYPAKLIELESNPDSITYNAWFEIENPVGNDKDTISYLRMTNKGITKEQLLNDSITTGIKYKYVVSTIKTGDCNPDIRTIRLERY